MRQKVLSIRLIAAALLSLAVSAPAYTAQAQAQPPAAAEPPRSITVSGSGQVSVQPDLAVITIGVETNADEAGAALTQNSEQMQALLTTLEEAGVPSEDIQTQALQLFSPDQQPPQPAPAAESAPADAQSASYRAVNLVEVTVRDLSQVGELIDQAVQAGGNQIQGIRFDISDPQAALDQARQAAWNDVRHKAEQWAELTGATLGDVLTINEFQSNIPFAAEAAFAPSAGMAVPVQPGTQRVMVDVQISWRLD